MSLQSNNRIGLLGGTFNPIHMGHLILAQSAFETFELSKVLFIPCQKPPHKSETNLLSAQHRRAMIELAIEADLRFELSDIELKRKGPSYSIDTVMELQNIYPHGEFFFIIGADTLPEIHLWKQIGNLLKMCRFVTFVRPGFETKQLAARGLKLDSPWPEKLLADVSPGIRMDISSSEVRYRIAEGMSIKYLVPAPVEMYLSEHRLYQA